MFMGQEPLIDPDNFGYHDWLVGFIDSPERDLSRNYSKLMACMDAIPYEWHNKMDENRQLDAFDMRDRYDFECFGGMNWDFQNWSVQNPVSFLEFLVTMLVRYDETVLTEPGDPPKTPEIFYILMQNMELLGYFDEVIGTAGYEPEKVCNFLCNFLKKSKKFHIFGVENEEKLDFWTACGRFLRDLV